MLSAELLIGVSDDYRTVAGRIRGIAHPPPPTFRGKTPVTRDVRIAARAAIARGTITRYSQSVRVNSDGSKSVETTEEEPGFKERLDALEQLARITGYA